MGAWAEDAFGNDTACDWTGEFAESPSIEKVEATLDAVLDEEDYVDSDVACEALVACEIVARLKDNWGERSAYSKEVDEWVRSSGSRPSGALVRKASAVIARILGEESELRELWDEDGVNAEWHAAMDDLARRVVS